MQLDSTLIEQLTDRRRKSRQGLVVVLTGDGKGKSTAAFGMALRAIGRQKRVRIFQFTKVASERVGEHRAFARLGMPIEPLGGGFDWDCRDAAHCLQVATRQWAAAAAAIRDERNFMVVLDDITYALRQGWVDLDDLLQTLFLRPQNLHVVLTGRNAPQDLLDMADTVTRMTMAKHHYMAGVAAQRGIED